MAMGWQQYNNRGAVGGGSSKSKRKECANPIFEEWLMEWKEDAVQKNSKMQFVYAKAINSLRKYPLPLLSGKECILLEFFGKALCQMIDQRIAKEPHRFSQGSSNDSEGTHLTDVITLDSPSSMPKSKLGSTGATKRGKSKASASDRGTNDSQSDTNEPSTSTAKKIKASKTKSYIPAFRSGAYAILATLFQKEEDPGYRGYMLKSELLREAQIHCDSSFTKPDNPGSKYTAWSSMATLVAKSYVIKQGNPVKFMLSVEGRELGAKLLNANTGTSAAQKAGPRSVLSSQSTDSNDEDSQPVFDSQQIVPRIEFLAGQFEIILYVDNGEASAKYKKEEVIGELRKNGVPLEVVKLNIGDFVWICRKVENSMGNRNRLTISRSNDVVLPYVVERKRSDDLAHSIKDGRFHEQKHRLEQTGLKPMYLIEAYGTGDWGLAAGALNQALANTQITDGFLIHETSSLKDTCGFLTHMTRHLSKLYLNKTIYSCKKEEWNSFKDSLEGTYLMAFNDFNEFATKTKNWTVSEMFARHILKLRGLSVERAHAIIDRYPTPHALFRAYKRCRDDKEKELLLSTIHFGTAGRTIGPALSNTIFKLYNMKDLT